MKNIKTMSPVDIYKVFNDYVVGQTEAKQSLAIALYKRLRRNSLPADKRMLVKKQNILLAGPTGVGKTELMRTIRDQFQLPTIEIDATLYSETGFRGADVGDIPEMLFKHTESTTKKLPKWYLENEYKDTADKTVLSASKKLVVGRTLLRCYIIGGVLMDNFKCAAFINMNLENVKIGSNSFEVHVKNHYLNNFTDFINQVKCGIASASISDNVFLPTRAFLNNLFKFERTWRKNPTLGIGSSSTTKPILILDEAMAISFFSEDLLAAFDVNNIDIDVDISDGERGGDETKTLLTFCQDFGVIFLDEIDKLITKTDGITAESRRAVQSTLLKMVEGAKYKGVKTDNILFVAAGAFSTNEVTDLLPELIGRFPIRAKLADLTVNNLIEIINLPHSEYNIALEYLKLDNIEVITDDDTVKAIAEMVFMLNTGENTGARKISYVVNELIFKDVMFNPKKFSTFDICGEALRVKFKLVKERDAIDE